jgi:hypothetical protein
MRAQLLGVMMVGVVGCGGSATPEPVHVTGATMQGKPVTPATAAASSRMLDQGPEAMRLQKLVGTWDVVMTMRPSPDAQPQIIRNLVAERAMHGLYLEERMHPGPNSGSPPFERIDYLTWDPIQTRWEYTSMDSRAPVGIMFARGFDRASGNGIGPASEVTVYFDNFANPGGAGEVGGTMRARHVDYLESNDHHVKQQYWTRLGAPEWLAVEYVYTRAKR